MNKNIKILRIFGKTLPIRDETLIKRLAEENKNCYFEKVISNNNSWYLTVKNIHNFNILKYFRTIKVHKKYCCTFLSFSDDFIQTEFSASSRKKIEIKENTKIKTKKLNNKGIEIILNKLLRLIDGSIVILFFKNDAQYRINRYNIHISKFADNLCIDDLIFVIEEWKTQNIENYGGIFQRKYEIVKENKEIIIKFTRKINPVLKKKEDGKNRD